MADDKPKLCSADQQLLALQSERPAINYESTNKDVSLKVYERNGRPVLITGSVYAKATEGTVTRQRVVLTLDDGGNMSFVNEAIRHRGVFNLTSMPNDVSVDSEYVRTGNNPKVAAAFQKALQEYKDGSPNEGPTRKFIENVDKIASGLPNMVINNTDDKCARR